MPDLVQQGESLGPTEAPSNKDLVIRDGFPALKCQDGSFNIQDTEPIPRHPVWAADTGLPVSQLHADAEAVFSARTRDDGAAYSAGVTYFLPCLMTPRCALEGLVQSIFRAHTDDIRSTYDETISGAEWWTLVMDEDDDGATKPPPGSKPNEAKPEDEDSDKPGNNDDEDDDDDQVGMHFDADYGLEAQAQGLLLHPRLATVTYLSDFGAPTIVWDCKSPPPGNIEDMACSVHRAWLSHPTIGKHLAFDGRFLHGAPTVFFPAKPSKLGDDRPTKRVKQDKRRITLLVNIWLNHCPVDAEPLDSDIIEQLCAPWDAETVKANSTHAFCWTPGAALSKQPAGLIQTAAPVADKPEDEAGSEEFVVCDHIIEAKYRSTMDSLHAASKAGDLVEICFEDGAFSLAVGGKVEDDTDQSETE